MPPPIGGVQPFAELARGGATVVYKGYQAEAQRFVLLKTVRAEGDLAERVEEEARLAAQVRHPNVVDVLGAGREGATAYLITEFVEGRDLGALLRRGSLPPGLAAYVLREAARGLAAVHDAGILHRDLKPANLLVADDGAVKLADFGFASLAPSSPRAGEGAGAMEGGEVRGTLAYLAPELVRGEAPRPASDLFSLGAVLAEALTGRPPFARAAAGDTLDAVLHHDAAAALRADPRVPSGLAELAVALLAKDPAQRPDGAAEVAAALDPLAAEAADLAAFVRDPASYAEPVAATPSLRPVADGVGATAAASARRRPWGVAAGVLLVLLAVAVGSRLVSDGAPPPVRPVAEVPADLPPAGPDRTRGSGEAAERPPPSETLPSETLPSETLPSETPSAMTARETSASDVAVPKSTAPGAAGPPGSSARPADGPVLAGEPDGVGATDGGSGPAAKPPEERANEAATGRLVVAAEPWARVHVDGVLVGTTPLGALSLAPGLHAVTFENPDFPALAVEVEVESGEEQRLAVSLWDLVGRVTVVVSPWAEVAVDGAVWDTVPPQERPLILAPGAHRLTFTHPVLGTREVELRIAAGEARTVRVNLAEAP